MKKIIFCFFLLSLIFKSKKLTFSAAQNILSYNSRRRTCTGITQHKIEIWIHLLKLRYLQECFTLSGYLLPSAAFQQLLQVKYPADAQCPFTTIQTYFNLMSCLKEKNCVDIKHVGLQVALSTHICESCSIFWQYMLNIAYVLLGYLLWYKDARHVNVLASYHLW